MTAFSEGVSRRAVPEKVGDAFARTPCKKRHTLIVRFAIVRFTFVLLLTVAGGACSQQHTVEDNVATRPDPVPSSAATTTSSDRASEDIEREGEQSLSDSVVAGDLSLASALLANGAEVDEPRVNGFTPLMRAAIRDDAAMVRLLVGHGADLSATTPGGLTAGHVAAEANAVNAMRVLIEAGVDLWYRSGNGMNTLHHAAAADGYEVVQLLAAAGMDLDERSAVVTQGHGYPPDVASTALGIAARAGNLRSIEELLRHGADVNMQSERGQTPLLNAVVAHRPPAVIQVLLDAGADPTIRVGCVTRCSLEETDVLGWAQRLGDPAVIPLLDVALAGWVGE